MVVPSADEPVRGLVGALGVPHAGPHRVEEGADGDVGLGDVGAGGDAAVRSGFLLGVGQGEAHRDDAVETSAQGEMRVSG